MHETWCLASRHLRSLSSNGGGLNINPFKFWSKVKVNMSNIWTSLWLQTIIYLGPNFNAVIPWAQCCSNKKTCFSLIIRIQYLFIYVRHCFCSSCLSVISLIPNTSLNHFKGLWNNSPYLLTLLWRRAERLLQSPWPKVTLRGQGSNVFWKKDYERVRRILRRCMQCMLQLAWSKVIVIQKRSNLIWH